MNDSKNCPNCGNSLKSETEPCGCVSAQTNAQSGSKKKAYKTNAPSQIFNKPSISLREATAQSENELPKNVEKSEDNSSAEPDNSVEARLDAIEAASKNPDGKIGYISTEEFNVQLTGGKKSETKSHEFFPPEGGRLDTSNSRDYDPDDHEEEHMTLVMDKNSMHSLAQAGKAKSAAKTAKTLEEIEHPQRHFIFHYEREIAATFLIIAAVVLAFNLSIAHKNVTPHYVSTVQKDVFYTPTLKPNNHADANDRFGQSSSAGQLSNTPEKTALTRKVYYRLGIPPFTAAKSGNLKSRSARVSFDGFDAAERAKLEAKNCTEVSFEGLLVTDNDLEQLAEMKNITLLDLQDTHGFSEYGLAAFKGTKLSQLYLDGTGVEDSWIDTLLELPLTRLSLYGVELSDESIEKLASSKNLQFLAIEANDSARLQKLFAAGNWMRLPEGHKRAFSFYRTKMPNR